MEIWKDIKDYEGLYQISNYGRVKSFPRKGTELKEKIIKVRQNNYGYLVVGLCKNNFRKYYLIHRLVAKAFIPNPDNLPCVNHKDENPKNAKATNLEWCTHKYNINYGTVQKRRSAQSQKVINQFDLNGNLIKRWNSILEAKTALNLKSISACCRRKQKTAGGYIWKYADDNNLKELR